MAIKTTRWSPDTCGCVLEYTWDDTQPESTRIHNFSRAVNKCPAHSSQTDIDCYSIVMDENPRKNIALQVALDNGPSTLYDMVDGQRQPKPTITYNYSWSGTPPNRVLTISFTGISLTNAQKTTIRTALNTRLGTGKVLIP